MSNDLRGEIQAEIAQAFNTDIAQATTTFTCTKEVSSGVYDPVTGTYQDAEVVEYSGRGVYGSYVKDLVKPTDYQVEDAKLIALQNEVSNKPQIGDVLVSQFGSHRVINVGNDPALATYTVQLRKVAG